MTTRRLFLAKLAGLAGFTLLSKAKGDYTKPVSLPVVVPRPNPLFDSIETYHGDFGSVRTTIDYDRLLYCISAVESKHDDTVIGPKGERSRYQIKPSVWHDRMERIETDFGIVRLHWPFHFNCHGENAVKCAVSHIHWLEPQLDALPAGRLWALAWCWRGGIAAWQDPYSIPERQHKSYRGYADRLVNLYNDPTYQHT